MGLAGTCAQAEACRPSGEGGVGSCSGSSTPSGRPTGCARGAGTRAAPRVDNTATRISRTSRSSDQAVPRGSPGRCRRRRATVNQEPDCSHAQHLRSPSRAEQVHRWCREAFAGWAVPHRTHWLDISLGRTHVVSLGTVDRVCLSFPGRTSVRQAARTFWRPRPPASPRSPPTSRTNSASVRLSVRGTTSWGTRAGWRTCSPGCEPGAPTRRS